MKRIGLLQWPRLAALPMALWLVGVAPLAAAESPVGCERVDFKAFRSEGTLKYAELARVLRHDAALYSDAREGRSASRLAFSQPAKVLDEAGARVKVQTFPQGNLPGATGWVDKKDLLCGSRPLKDDSGLERKFFIRTDTVARKDDGSAPQADVFQEPELVECVGGNGTCLPGASRFHMYFVFDERPGAVLLADRFHLEAEDALLGWVRLSDGFQWNNAYGIRPSETLVGAKGDVGSVCTYDELADAVARRKDRCNPVQGGAGWFKGPTRIPVLDLVDARGRAVSGADAVNDGKRRLFYRVAMARPGLVGRDLGDGRIALSGDLARRILPELSKLKAKKRVDIFFLLDGTASMEPYIDAVRGTAGHPGLIHEIISSLKARPGFEETQFRFGFRVYRDPYAQVLGLPGPGDGVGEGFPLPEQCSFTSEAQRQEVFRQFSDSLAQVKVTSDDQDDYEENLFGGLKQSLSEDMASCPEHLKVLFIIGDHGYRASTDKYREPVSPAELVELFKGGEGKDNNVLHFFIQTPWREQGVKTPGAYRNAYAQFESQARQLLGESLPVEASVKDHFLRLDENNLVPRLLQAVEGVASSGVIDEIILDLQGGKALNAIIERLQRERVDVPGVYWHILKKDACGELGKQCQEQVFDTTRVAYVEASDDVVEDLWVSSRDLTTWVRLLERFKSHYGRPEQELRRALGETLISGLQMALRSPPMDVVGETAAQYAQRKGGLPVRRFSPLLSYPMAAIEAKRVRQDAQGRQMVVDDAGRPVIGPDGQPIQAVPMCELRRLTLWAIQSREMLAIVEQGGFRPVYQTAPYAPTQCPDATPLGHALIRVTDQITREPLGPDESYSYSHAFGGERGYWVPQRYLP
ncbi:MAG: hypothetical protein H7831_07245 [Magnetococcus sp. WYHC-3]